MTAPEQSPEAVAVGRYRFEVRENEAFERFACAACSAYLPVRAWWAKLTDRPFCEKCVRALTATPRVGPGKEPITMAWREYPLGTKAHAVSGGYWVREEDGWRWPGGSIFPTPGGDAVSVTVPDLATPREPEPDGWVWSEPTNFSDTWTSFLDIDGTNVGNFRSEDIEVVRRVMGRAPSSKGPFQAHPAKASGVVYGGVKGVWMTHEEHRRMLAAESMLLEASAPSEAEPHAFRTALVEIMGLAEIDTLLDVLEDGPDPVKSKLLRAVQIATTTVVTALASPTPESQP